MFDLSAGRLPRLRLSSDTCNCSPSWQQTTTIKGRIRNPSTTSRRLLPIAKASIRLLPSQHRRLPTNPHTRRLHTRFRQLLPRTELPRRVRISISLLLLLLLRTGLGTPTLPSTRFSTTTCIRPILPTTRDPTLQLQALAICRKTATTIRILAIIVIITNNHHSRLVMAQRISPCKIDRVRMRK